MSQRNSMSTAAKLLSSFGVVVALLLALGVASMYGLSRLETAAKTVYDDRLMPIHDLGAIAYLQVRNRVLVMDMMENASAANVQKRVAEIDKNLGEIDKLWKGYMATTLTAEEKVLADEFLKARTAFESQGIQPAVAAIRAGNADGAKAAYAQISKLNPAATEGAQKLIDLQKKVAAEENEAGKVLVSRLDALTVTLSLLAVATAIGIALLLTRSIVRALGAEPADLAQVAERIAGGDLSTVDTRQVPAGSVMASMQAMQQSLSKVVRDVRVSVDSVATASAQIAAGNQDLSSRTEEQASSLQQTAASMEQMTSSVKTNADSARQADALARAAAEVAERGGSAVGEVVTTMAAIQASSRRIEEIISVIDGIAFQTNILALNAAVEAARAGEQGRGFAVVAGEVRNLAQRSAQAAKEIKSLIGDSVEKINDGSNRVQAAGQTIGEVVEQVNRVSRLIGEITAATLEQSGGISQVNEAVTQLDQVTQQNAALVEESTAAAASLREQADKLAHAVAVFKLSHEETASLIATAQRSSKASVGATPIAARKPRSHAAARTAPQTAHPAPAARGDATDDWKEF